MKSSCQEKLSGIIFIFGCQVRNFVEYEQFNLYAIQSVIDYTTIILWFINEAMFFVFLSVFCLSVTPQRQFWTLWTAVRMSCLSTTVSTSSPRLWTTLSWRVEAFYLCSLLPPLPLWVSWYVCVCVLCQRDFMCVYLTGRIYSWWLQWQEVIRPYWPFPITLNYS